jgi:ligand-binding SRPBCC domain-containing protein
MMLPFVYGLGGPLGHGRQFMSWIHIDDAVQGIMKALEDSSIKGPVNIVAPEAVTNTQLTKALAVKTRLPAIFRAPAFVLKLVLGEMSSMLLGSSNVRPGVLITSGFKFQFPDISTALSDLLAYSQPHGTRLFVARQWITGSPSENFPFFSAAENLETITPPWLNFRIVAKSTPDISEGTLIDYKLKIKGVPVRWRTRIENWAPPHKFVDTQLRGPYKTWHHTHRFEQLGNGTLMTDIVRYRMHAWPFGDFALPMVKNDVYSIFKYRRQVIEKTLSSKYS